MQPDEFNKIVGNNLRKARINRGFSQQALGNACEITFQQVQKYEKGANGLSAYRLFQMANVLDISPISLS